MAFQLEVGQLLTHRFERAGYARRWVKRPSHPTALRTAVQDEFGGGDQF